MTWRINESTSQSQHANIQIKQWLTMIRIDCIVHLNHTMALNLKFKLFFQSTQIHLENIQSKHSSADYNQSTADPSMDRPNLNFINETIGEKKRARKTCQNSSKVSEAAGSNIDALTSLHNGLRHTRPALASICRYNAAVADVSIDTRAAAAAVEAPSIWNWFASGNSSSLGQTCSAIYTPDDETRSVFL